MKKGQITLAKLLTYCGTLPLVMSLLPEYLHLSGLNTAFVANTYSAIIISFLCGIHWAVYLLFDKKCPNNMLITSNAVTLLAWSSLLITNNFLAIVLQVFCFFIC